jgi:hypothetical protein
MSLDMHGPPELLTAGVPRSIYFVMRGLDPRSHLLSKLILAKKMDRRVKPAMMVLSAKGATVGLLQKWDVA